MIRSLNSFRLHICSYLSLPSCAGLPYRTVPYCTVPYCTVLYRTVLYCTVLYSTLLYCIVLFVFTVELSISSTLCRPPRCWINIGFWNSLSRMWVWNYVTSSDSPIFHSHHWQCRDDYCSTKSLTFPSEILNTSRSENVSNIAIVGISLITFYSLISSS